MGLFDRIREAKKKAQELAEKASLKVVEKFAPELREVREQAEQLSPADQWAESGIGQAVESSWVAGIRYIKEDKFLDVQFNSGAACRYPGKQMQEAINFYNATSKGKWVNEHLRPLGRSGYTYIPAFL